MKIERGILDRMKLNKKRLRITIVGNTVQWAVRWGIRLVNVNRIMVNRKEIVEIRKTAGWERKLKNN